MAKRQPIRIVLSGGGTGGHVYPAIAIADAFKNLPYEVDILFIGAKGKVEMKLVPEAGYSIVGLPIRGLQRRFTISNFWFPFPSIREFAKGFLGGPFLQAGCRDWTRWVCQWTMPKGGTVAQYSNIFTRTKCCTRFDESITR